MRALTAEFPLAPGLVMLNHASYGLAPRAILDRAEQLRRELESDPDIRLGAELHERLTHTLARIGARLGLDPAFAALTSSATSGAAALQRSIPLGYGEVVIALSCEYSSVLRGWQRRCTEVEADFRIVDVDLPFDDPSALLGRLDEVAGADRIAVLQFSAITSSTAIALPVNALAAWGRARGATVLVDAAHAPGQIEVDGWRGVDAVFATAHKWFPVPRSVGLLWAKPALAGTIHPAETSLTHDAWTLAERFSWPGTYDPSARLTLPAALALHQEWADAGLLTACEQLADYAGDVLTEAGAVPTAGPGFRPPRMRAFRLPGVPAPLVRQRLAEAGIRTWIGAESDTGSLLRVATHVYNDEDDLDRLATELRGILNGRSRRQ
jgi:isopenicillin-N epimerase